MSVFTDSEYEDPIDLEMLEEMFHVGGEELKDTEQFWKDWIGLLQKKNGDAEARLLKEAILYCEGIDGLYEMAK